jgi:hypothetical protein
LPVSAFRTSAASIFVSHSYIAVIATTKPGVQ